MPCHSRAIVSTSACTLAFAAGLLLVACHQHSPSPLPPHEPTADIPLGSDPVVAWPVVTGPAGRLLLTFEDQLSATFRLTGVTFALDGQAVLHCRIGDGTLDASTPMFVYDGDLAAGQHQLEARLTYRGHGEGIFSYLSGYTFDVQGVHAFDLQQAQFLALHITAWERGDAETALSDRPQLRFEDRSTDPVHAVVRAGCPWGE